VHHFVSFKPGRNQVWRGHESEKGVRQAIAYGRRNLRIFERVGEPGDMHIEYSEILPEDWADRFGA
jgi:hypothetical protein